MICSTNVKNLSIIFAGPVPPNPAELLGSRHFKAMLDSLKKVYDYILIDTPPLGSVIDSAIIAEECDGAMIVIESGVISYRCQPLSSFVRESSSWKRVTVRSLVLF